MLHQRACLTLARASAGVLLALLASAGMVETVAGGPGTVLGVGMGGGLVVALVAAWAEPTRRPTVLTVGRRMLLAAWFYLAAVGSVAMSGAVGVLSVAASAACWVAGGRLASGRAGGDIWQRIERHLSNRASSAESLRDFLRSLDDDTLMRLWTGSRQAVGPTQPVRQALRAARVREHLLDEVERRDPTAFRAWLEGGARSEWPARPGG